MPIPLGILAAAGVRAAGGSYELIETITVGAGGAASVTFSNLNTYSTTYQHLQIRAVTNVVNSSTDATNLIMRFNGDSANNYASHRLWGDAGSVVSYSTTSASSMFMGLAPRTASGSVFWGNVIDILDPYEAKNKTVRSLSGGTNTSQSTIAMTSGLWMSTASVTSVTLYDFGALNFAQNSRFSIYGLKAS